MNRSGNRFSLPAWTAALLAILWAGFGDRVLTHWAYAVERGRLQATSEELAEVAEIANLRAISKAFRMVAKVARPGVVHIQTSGGRLSDAPRGELERLLERLGDMLSREQIEQLSRRPQPPGSGSGIVFDAEGHILTNNHVVAGRTEITVHLSDERTHEASLVGTDPKTDLAVIKIDAPDLHPLTFGDSEKVEVGDWVLAVGAPFGLTQTVTHGIVSATGRTNVAGLDVLYQNFIQTDAAINPGNSGGPLLNLRGEVLGVNMAIATHGETFNAGVAFTIPSNMAVKIAKQLIAKGEVARGWLGITYPAAPLTEEDAEIFNLPNTRGILITSVHKNSPADKAGLQVEDVIVAVAGEPIRGGEYFKAVIADLGPQERVRFRLIRDGKEKELRLRLGLQPRDMRAAFAAPAIRGRQIAALGLNVRAFGPGLRQEYAAARAYDETERGVFVLAIEAASDQQPKIRPYELIVACNGEPVMNPGELLKALKAASTDEKVRLQILQPDGDRRIIRVRKKSGR